MRLFAAIPAALALLRTVYKSTHSTASYRGRLALFGSLIQVWHHLEDVRSRCVRAKRGSFAAPIILSVCILAVVALPAKETWAACRHAAAANGKFYSLLTPPDLQLGDQLLRLPEPELDKGESVQTRLLFIGILGELIAAQMPKRTNGLCRVFADRTYFPDLYLFVSRTNRSHPADADRASCMSALHNLLLYDDKVEAADLRRAQESLLKNDVLARSSQDIKARTIWLLWRTLAHIYPVDTTLGALISWEPRQPRDKDVTEFASWLFAQRDHFSFASLSTCDEPSDLRRSFAGSNERLPSPKEEITLSLGNQKSRNPNYIVVVGNNEQAVARSATGDAAPGCDKTILVSGSNPGFPQHSVQIRCTSWLMPFHADGWIAFYCDPSTCQSEGVEQAAMKAIASDQDIIDLARQPSGEGRGPYLVRILRSEN